LRLAPKPTGVRDARNRAKNLPPRLPQACSATGPGRTRQKCSQVENRCHTDYVTELDERVARVREMCSREFGNSAFLAHNILLTLDGNEPEEQGQKSNPDDDEDCCGPHEPVESTFLEKVAGRTLATVGVLCLVALMIGATLALLRWWL
jgi:hypothetical protein